MKIIGISHPYYTHDNSMALIENGKLIFAESEERLSRIKHDGAFPKKAIENCLKRYNLNYDSIDYIAIGFPPPKFISFVSGLFKRNIFDPFIFIFYMFFRSPISFYRFIKEKLAGIFANKKNDIEILAFPQEKIIIVEHERSHVGSAYFNSGFDRSLGIALDSAGSKLDGSFIAGEVFICENGKMESMEVIPHYASFGAFYEAISISLGFDIGDGAGKTMGLASYGNPNICYNELEKLCPRFKDGKWFLSTSWWIDYETMSRKDENKDIFMYTRTGRYLKQLLRNYSNMDIAAAAQKLLEDRVMEYLNYLIEKYKIRDIVAAGGIFFNIKLNKKILESDYVNKLYIFPNAGDGGCAVGAALDVYYRKYSFKNAEPLKLITIGSGFSEDEIEAVLNHYRDKIVFERVDNIAELAAEKIANGMVIGWFQGRAEFGPRALGCRSVIADPRKVENRERINSVLKRRDWFMPFAPSILKEDLNKHVRKNIELPFMILAADATVEAKKQIPAAIHIDDTLRIHSVDKSVNPLYWDLINNFKRITGVPAVLNTSFNRHGLPIVHSPLDAVEHLIWGCVDGLAIGNFFVVRKS